ncbi:MAG: response regulator [Rhodothermales bacterium]
MPTIVIIDDNEELRELAAEVLREEGHIVEVAADGLAGMSAISKLVPDLIISDISMPGLDGLALRSRLNDLPGLAEIPFLFISAHREPETIRRGMMLGADDYLTKPFKINDLLTAVGSRLKRRDLTLETERRRVSHLSESLQLIFPHEISTPLSQLMVAALLLKEVEPSEAGEFVDIIQQAAERLNRLTQAFRDVTTLSMRDEHGMADLPIRVPEAVDQAASLEAWTTETAADLEATDRVRIHLSGFRTDVNPAYLQRLLIELLRNAIQYSDGIVEVEAAIQNDRAVLSVRDEGPGFDPAALAIPTPFVQIDRRTSERQGLGLGLFLVRRMVALMDGTLGMNHRDGAGMDMRIEIPATA